MPVLLGLPTGCWAGGEGEGGGLGTRECRCKGSAHIGLLGDSEWLSVARPCAQASTCSPVHGHTTKVTRPQLCLASHHQCCDRSANNGGHDTNVVCFFLRSRRVGKNKPTVSKLGSPAGTRSTCHQAAGRQASHLPALLGWMPTRACQTWPGQQLSNGSCLSNVVMVPAAAAADVGVGYSGTHAPHQKPEPHQ